MKAMKWQIVKTTYGTQNPYLVDTYEGGYEDAVLYAVMLAEEHAKSIDVELTEYGYYGATFTTNNGTPVSYTVAGF